MSTFDIHMNRHKGFVKSWWAKREDFYWNSRMSPAQPRFQRYCGRHKHSLYQIPHKQFDIRFLNYCKHFKAHTPIPRRVFWESDNICWRFGVKGRKKFMYTNRE